MIIDQIDQCDRYLCLGERFAQAFEILKTTDFTNIPSGKYPVDGDQLYYLVQEYMSKPFENGKIEAHKKYADIQVIVQGKELVGYGDISTLKKGSYIEDKDFQALEGKLDFLTLHSGSFMILFPNDAHMPGIWSEESIAVKKVVFKVKL